MTACCSSASSDVDSPVVPSATIPAQPASRYSWHRRVDRVEGDGSVGRERGDERDVDPLQQPLGAWRQGIPSASSRARRKTSSSHRLGQPAGERVLLTRVVAAEDHEPFGRHFETVGELRSRHRERRAARGEDARQRFVGEPAEHHDDPHTLEQRQLALEIRQAPVALFGRRLVVRRRAPHRGRDVRVAQLEPVVRRHRGRLVREAESMQRAEEPVARTIAGEDPPGAVPTVRGRREPGDQHRAPADRRNREPGVPNTSRHETPRASRWRPLAPLDEPRARAARDDLVGQRAQLVGAGTGHIGIVRVGFAAVRLQLIVNPIASSVHDARTRDR